MKKLKPDVFANLKELSADIRDVQEHLYDTHGNMDEYLAEELDVLQSEYKAIINNPDSYI